MLIRLIFLFLLTLGAAWGQCGQTVINGANHGALDCIGTPTFTYTGVLSGLPATCTVGQLAFVTNATPGQQVYMCSATNVWTQQLNSGAAGASQALDNLASVSINTSLLAQTGVDAGSAAKPFRNLYIWGTGTYGSTSIKFTGVPTANRTVTVPDADLTLARIDAAQTFTGVQTFSTPIALTSLASTVVNATAPGAGIAHFAGSTQTVTSSLIVNADITAGTIAAAKLIGTDIATVGTITTGTWSGTSITNSKGGTGGDSSAATGIAHVSSGTWSYSAIVNADITNGTIAAAKLIGTDITTVGTIATGTWSATAIANTKGGTGGDSSGSTGIAHVAAGTWSYSTIVAADIAANAVTLAKLATQTADTVLMNASGSTAVPSAVAVTNCGDSTHALAYSTSSHVFSCQAITATGTPGGSDTQVQFNDAGALGGDAGMVYNKTTDALTIAGVFTALSVSTGTSPPSLTPGTGGADAFGEGTVPSVGAATAVDVCYADSTQHGLLCSFNNGSYLPLVQGPASSTANHVPTFNATNGGLLKDSGLTLTASTGTITLANGKTFTINNTLTFSGTDGTTMTLPGTSQTIPGVNQTNTGGASFTLDMSASTSAASLRAPNIAGAAPTTAGTIAYDTTNKNLHVGANSVDTIAGLFLASALPTDQDCIKASVSSSVVRLASAGAACGSGSGGSAGAPLFTQTADATVANSTSETTVIGSGVGSKTTSANYFAAGTSILVEMGGYFQSAAVDTLNIKIKAGSTVVGATGAVAYGVLGTNQAFRLYALITCRTAGASGTFQVDTIFETTGSALTGQEAKIINTSDITLDTTGTLAWDITATWSAASASDTITGKTFTMYSPGSAVSSVGGLTGAITSFSTATLNSVALTGMGVPLIGWKSNVTNQSASQSAVTLATAPTAGDYEIHYSMDTNTPCTTGTNSVYFTFNWTAASARSLGTGTFQFPTAQATTSYMNGIIPIHVASGNVTYTSTVTGTCASGTSSYDLNVWMVRVN